MGVTRFVRALSSRLQRGPGSASGGVLRGVALVRVQLFQEEMRPVHGRAEHRGAFPATLLRCMYSLTRFSLKPLVFSDESLMPPVLLWSFLPDAVCLLQMLCV